MKAKFLPFFESNRIMMWKDFYINYSLMKEILSPLHLLYKAKLRSMYLQRISLETASDEVAEQALSSRRHEPQINVEKIRERFCQQFIIELKKAEFFYKETMTTKIEKRLTEIQEQIEYLNTSGYFEKFKTTFELALKELYKEISLLKQFADLNVKVKNKLLKKYRKNIKLIFIDAKIDYKKDNIEAQIKEFVKNSSFHNYEKKIEQSYSLCSEMFARSYSHKYRDKLNKVLKINSINEEFSQSNSFKLGLGLGIAIFEIIVIICSIFNYRSTLFMDEYLFLNVPNFRGFCLIILYTLFMATNFYVWAKKNFSYKIILKIPFPEIEAYEIFFNSDFFSVLFFTIFMFYMFNKVQMPFLFGFNDMIPNFVFPIFFWSLYFIYFLSPFSCCFNYQGRAYICKTLIECIQIKTSFKHIFMVEQLITLIPIFRDFAYTICYYWHINDSNLLVESHCGYETPQAKFMIITSVPILFRIFQSISLLIKCSKFHRNNAVKTVNILHIIKNTLFIAATTISYLSFIAYGYRKKYYLIRGWITLAIFGAILSFIVDVKYDYGLLKSGKFFPLRVKTFYSKSTYYILIFLTFILRIAFFFLISPEIIVHFGLNFNWSMLILGPCEILRRFIWNCIRIELKHIEVANKYQLTNDVKLPLDKTESGFILKREFYSIYNRQKLEEKKIDEIVADNGIYLRQEVNGISNTNYNPDILLEEYNPDENGSERFLYDSRTMGGEVEDFEKQGDLIDTIYANSLNNYLKDDYYKNTLENLKGEEEIINEIEIIDPEFIYKDED